MQAPKPKDKIRVGQIVNIHGLKGEVKVYPLTDYPQRFDEISEIYIEDSSQKRKILSAKYHKNMAILKIEGINSVEEAEKMRESFLFIDRDNTRELEEDEHLITDLIGLTVEDTKGKFIGTLQEIIPYSANDVYVIKSPSGKEHLIPGLKRFIPIIDVENGKIIVDPIEGMIEE